MNILIDYICAENNSYIKYVLKKEDPNIADKKGFTALMAAAEKGHAHVVNLLKNNKNK